MKIGKFDVSINIIAYVAGFIAAVVFLFVFWRRNSDLRYESFCRGTIYRAMYDDSGESTAKGIEYCQSLISSQPNKAVPRLYLGDLLFKMKNYRDSQKAYDDAANCTTVRPYEKAWAYTGAGVAFFMGSSKDPAKAAAGAMDFFKKALEADKACVDAMINMGLAELQKGGEGAVERAEKYANEALLIQTPSDGKEGRAIAPSVRAQEQLYILKAMLSARKSKASDSVAYFDRARALRLSTGTIENNKRMAMLVSVTEKDVDPATRKELLAKLEVSLGKFGKDMVSAYNALGIGFSMLRSEPDYATGPLAAAIRNLSKAMETDPKDLRAYYNMAAIYDERVKDIATKLNVQITGISGETPQINRWTGSEKLARFTPQERMIIEEIRKVLLDEELMWKKFQEKAKLQPADKIDGKLRQLACLRRQAYLLEDAEGLRAPVMLKANNVAQELEKLDPENPTVHAALGYLLLDKGDYQGANKEFQKAVEKGMKSPTLDKLISGLSVKPEVGDVRPGEGRRYFGPRPLIGGTLKALTAGGPPKKAVMKIDDKPVPAVLGGALGLQVLYFPGERDLTDGDHTVSISMSDSMGQTVDFPSFQFGLDKSPPKVSLTPDISAPLSTKPVFKATIEDRSGVDFSSLKITLRPASGKGTLMLLVGDGRVKRTMPETTPPHKIGYIIDNENFEFSAGQELTVGDYDMQITVSDMAGNLYNENKRFTVKH